jgi:GT2 family glycosyltransferase
MIPRDVWVRLDGFDESYFMYGEDTDLCLRARALGVPSVVCPEATLIHHGGQSEKVRADKMIRLFKAKRQLFETHWSRPCVWFGVSMLMLWAATRAYGIALLQAYRPALRESGRTWHEIWTRRGEYAY